MELQHAHDGLQQQRERPQRRPLLLAAQQPAGRPDAPVIIDAHIHINAMRIRALRRCKSVHYNMIIADSPEIDIYWA